MFSIFEKKSRIEKLNDKYKEIQQEAYMLSTSNRTKSDQKYAEAQEILKKIEAIQKEGNSRMS